MTHFIQAVRSLGKSYKENELSVSNPDTALVPKVYLLSLSSSVNDRHL